MQRLSKNLKVRKQERRRKELFPEVQIHHRESYVSVEEAPTSRVSFNRFPLQARSHLSSASTNLISSLPEARSTFRNFPVAHHKHGSSPATPSRLGGFTSKSIKRNRTSCRELKCSRMDFSSLALNLPISRPNSLSSQITH